MTKVSSFHKEIKHEQEDETLRWWRPISETQSSPFPAMTANRQGAEHLYTDIHHVRCASSAKFIRRYFHLGVALICIDPVKRRQMLRARRRGNENGNAKFVNCTPIFGHNFS